MFAITGITGQVGGALAGALLDAGLPVRAIARDPVKAAIWATRGCEIARADMADAAALADAFRGAEGVFILPPSDFDPEPGYPEAKRVIAAVRRALDDARPRRIVCLSTIGADAQQDNLLTQRTLMEQALSTLSIPVTFLRPGWFIENAAWDVGSARDEGVIRSFLAPLDRRIAMVAVADIGRIAAALIRERWTGVRIVELEGPERVSPDDLAAAFATALGRPVRAEAIPRDAWEALFRAQGARNPLPRMRMIDGFNEGWIDFAQDNPRLLRGRVSLNEAIAALVAADGQRTN